MRTPTCAPTTIESSTRSREKSTHSDARCPRLDAARRAPRGAARRASLPGDVAFDLYETHGFPLEVTTEIAAERGVDVDLAGYEAALKNAQEISGRKTSHAAHYENLTDFQSVLDQFGPTDFVGREEFETKATVLAIVGDSVFLDRSPFYAESGGQVGDTGTITTDTGRAEVLDTTFALPGLHRHVVQVVDGELVPGQEATAAIDVARRDAIRRNHTGTHILHWALRRWSVIN